jgi:hypothetical protein
MFNFKNVRRYKDHDILRGNFPRHPHLPKNPYFTKIFPSLVVIPACLPQGDAGRNPENLEDTGFPPSRERQKTVGLEFRI